MSSLSRLVPDTMTLAERNLVRLPRNPDMLTRRAR